MICILKAGLFHNGKSWASSEKRRDRAQAANVVQTEYFVNDERDKIRRLVRQFFAVLPFSKRC